MSASSDDPLVSSHWYAPSSSCAKRGSPALASAAALAALAGCADDIDRSAIEPQDARLQVGLQLAAAELKSNPLPFCRPLAKLNYCNKKIK